MVADQDFESGGEESAWDPVDNPVGTLEVGGEIARAELLNVIKGGKEAVVYCCKVKSRSGTRLLAAKAYRTQSFLHGFRNDNLYQDGRWTAKTRPERAFVKKTGFGRALQFATWIGIEDGALVPGYPVDRVLEDSRDRGVVLGGRI